MIPVTEIRSSLEKTAGPMSKAIWEGLGGTLKLMGKHPRTTIALLAGTAGTLALAKNVHPLHQMVREETKNKILKDQRSLLKQMLEAKNKKPAAEPKKQKMIITPLT